MSQDTSYHAPINVDSEFDKDGQLKRPIWPVFAVFGFIFLVALVVYLVRFFIQR